MARLTVQTLRGILARVLSVDESFIVPKQGNWWNPSESKTAHTWCAFSVRQTMNRTVPQYMTENGTNYAVVLKRSSIDLQFVGTQAEDLAHSVCFWYLRDDVIKEFRTVNGTVLPDNVTVVSSPFYQEGLNNVTAYNVSISVLWYDIIDTEQKKLTAVDGLGGIIWQTSSVR